MKHLFTLALFVCLGTFANAQIPSYVPPNGLVGWWPFNGNANDESGNGNHGTVNGATLAADRFGNTGKAYGFDGNSDFIQIPNQSLTNSVSFSVWTKMNSFLIPRYDVFFLTNQANNNDIYSSNIAFGFRGIGTEFGPSCYVKQNNGLTGYFSINTTPNSAQWNNFTYVFENGQYVKIYLNNQLIYIFNSPGMNPSQNSYPIILGGSGTSNYWFNGLLDDIAIYNRALTPAEVRQLFLAGCQPTFTAQPQNKSVAQGQTTIFAVQVDTTSTFQWQMNLGLGAGWVNIPQSALFSGDTTSMLSVQGRSTIDGAQFRCIATTCQSDTSNAATLTVTSNASTLGSVAGVPGKINYQGAAVDSAGKPMKNQTIALKLSVLDSSSTGAAAYVETHSTPTNGSGLFSLQIGGGTAVSGTFDSIPWANGRNKYLKTEVQQNGTWVSLGTSQLVSVPYALVSGVAKRAEEANFLRDSLGNAYQIKTVNGQPTLVSAPGNVSSPAPFACGQAVFYAGESYPTVQIGTQCWFQKNVNAGTMVQGANEQTNNGILEKYCYNNDTANCTIYGGLYQWAEAVQYQNGASNTTSPSPAFTGNVRGLCPTGWHVPSDGEYCMLTTFLDATVNCGTTGLSGTDAGGKMKSTSGLWASPNLGATNSSGFSALPGGYRYAVGAVGAFDGIGFNPSFWSSSEFYATFAVDRFLDSSLSEIERSNHGKGLGFSIRCLKD